MAGLFVISFLFTQRIPHHHGVVREFFECVCEFLAFLVAPSLCIFFQLRKFFDDQRSHLVDFYFQLLRCHAPSLAKSHDLIR